MRVLLTGGGTGGHITPLLAVAHKLKSIDPKIEVIYVGDRGSKFASMTAGQTVFDGQYKVFAGKFRRYNGESWLKRLLDVQTNLLNIRDLFYLAFGIIESWFLLRKLKPDVILLKGGFVGVPIGLAGKRRFPIITHDSDALPGLANRLVSRWATYHATGMPASFYNYPPAKVKYVGVIVSDAFKQVSTSLKKQYRQNLAIPPDADVLMVTGGSLGAQSINKAVAKFARHLLEKIPNLTIIHQVGQGNEAIYGNYANQRLTVSGLLDNLDLYSGAADVIVTRAGANTIAEFGIQAKPCIVVPNPLLTGGHQLKNADYLTAKHAAVVVDDDKLASDLELAITDLLKDKVKQQQLAKRLHDLTKPDAAQQLAELLIEVGQGSQ